MEWHSVELLFPVSSGTHTSTYAYHTSASLIATVTATESSSLKQTSSRSYDVNGRLTSIQTLDAASQPMFTAAYAYDAIHRRTSTTREEGLKWDWGYNDRSEVTSGTRKFADGSTFAELSSTYAYDGIGNFTSRSTGGQSSTWTPNSVNQYTGRTVPNKLTVTGEASEPTRVVVQGKPAERKDQYFWRTWSVDNASTLVRENVRIAAALPGAGPGGEDLATLKTGQLFLSKATETFTYDADGNLTEDSRWTYTWDAENRLLGMEEKSFTAVAGWERHKLSFGYDAYGRRIRKAVQTWDTGASQWEPESDLAFLYDGWNLLAEVNVANPSTPKLLRSYTWGLDLSGSEQDAGGVGGMLAVAHYDAGGSLTHLHLPGYDGNGNVVGYTDAALGTSVLRLDYDAFGNAVTVARLGINVASSASAKAIPHRFSTKYNDAETGLYYYGYRYYTADTGRWLNEDPIGEVGGVNLYGFVQNDPISWVDAFGLDLAPSLALPAGAALEAAKGAGASSISWGTFTNVGAAGTAVAGAIALAVTETWKAYALADRDIAVCEMRRCEDLSAILKSLVDMVATMTSMVSVALSTDGGSNNGAANAALTSTATALDAAAVALEGLADGLRMVCGEGSAGSALTYAATARETAERARGRLSSMGRELGGGAVKTISTGRTAPKSLKEKLAMEEVMAKPMGTTPSRMPPMSDSKNNLLASDGWVKRVQNVNGVEIHYVENVNTKQVLDFKFKD